MPFSIVSKDQYMFYVLRNMSVILLIHLKVQQMKLKEDSNYKEELIQMPDKAE